MSIAISFKELNNYGVVNQLYRFNQWIPYIDIIFQFNIMFSNYRLLYLPTRLQYATIDSVLHKRLAEELPEDGGLPVYYYKNIDIVKFGIELRKVKFSVAPRRQKPF